MWVLVSQRFGLVWKSFGLGETTPFFDAPYGFTGNTFNFDEVTYDIPSWQRDVEMEFPKNIAFVFDV